MSPLARAIPMTPRRRRSAFALASLLVAAIVSTFPGGSEAQVARAWSYDTPLDPYGTWRGARVLAMGNLSVAVEDDRNPFGAYTSFGNPAGFLTARDSSWVEQGSSYRDYFDRYYGEGHSVVNRTGAVRVGWLVGDQWAIGADVRYSTILASRHDLGSYDDRSRFIRDFDVSVPDYFVPRTGDRTLGAGVTSPAATVTYARRFWPWLTLGGQFSHRSEQEDRTVLNDPYDFDNRSAANEVRGGLLLHPSVFANKAEVGLYASWTGNKVTGVSSSPLNDDTYDLARPQVSWGAQILAKTGWLRGIVEGHHHSYDGEQIARVNWAPQFFLNPFPSDTDQDFVFKKRWTSALVGLRHNQASTRWMADVPGTPLHVGARYAYHREYQWSQPLPDVLSPMLPLNVRRLGYRGAGGLSFHLPENGGAVAMEVQIEREHRADWSQETDPSAGPAVVPDVDMAQISYHLGAEYKARPWLPLRAGVALRRYDPDRRDGLPPLRGIRLSAGTSYHWTALGVLIDGAWAREHFRHSPQNPSLELGRSDELTITFQHLF